MYFFVITGMAALAFGLYVRMGGAKIWYLVQGTPILVPRALQGALIPLGITFIVLGIILSNLIPTVEARGNLFCWLYMPMLAATIILAMLQPRWLQPRWLSYLEARYGDTTYHLLQEAAKDPRAWAQQVSTQAGLEAWAEETRQKLGYPP